jgi:hypothetical protein
MTYSQKRLFILGVLALGPILLFQNCSSPYGLQNAALTQAELVTADMPQEQAGSQGGASGGASNKSDGSDSTNNTALTPSNEDDLVECTLGSNKKIVLDQTTLNMLSGPKSSNISLMETQLKTDPGHGHESRVCMSRRACLGMVDA